MTDNSTPIEDQIRTIIHRVTNCAALHQGDPSVWIDGTCITMSMAQKEIIDLIAHLASEAKPPKSHKAQRAYRIESNDFAAVVKEKAYNKGVDTYYSNINKALGRET